MRVPRPLAVLLLLVSACLQALRGQDLLKAWQPMKAMEGSEAIRNMAVATDGGLVLVLTGEHQVRVYDPVKKETLRLITDVPGKVVAMAGSGLKGPVLIATEHALYSAPATGADPAVQRWACKESIYAITCAPTQAFVAVATSDGAFIVNSRTGDVALSTREATCLAAQFAPNEKTLALAMGKRVVIYDVPSFNLKQDWAINGFVYALAYAPDAEFLAIGGEGNSLTLKRVVDGQTVKSLSLGMSARQVDHLAFAGDQSGLFVAAGQRLIVFDHLNQDHPVARPIKLDDKIHSLGFSKAAEALLAGTENQRALSMWGVTLPKPPEALVAFEAVTPPTLTLLAPAAETLAKDTLQELSFNVESNAKQEVSGIRVLVDGRPARVLAAQAPLGARPESVNGVLSRTFRNGETYHYRVEVPSQDATLVVLAESPFATSLPRVARIRWDVATPPPPAREPIQVEPPTVTILAPGPEASLNEPSLALAVRVKASPAQPVTNLRVLVDGAPVPDLQELGGKGLVVTGTALPADQAFRYRIPVPTRDSTVVVIAETAYANSNPAVIRVHWQGRGQYDAPVKPMPDALVPPTVRILAAAQEITFKDLDYVLALQVGSAPDQDIRQLRVFLDGAPLSLKPEGDGQDPFRSGASPRFRVPLPDRDCTLMVLAESNYRQSEPAILRLKYDRPPAPLVKARVAKPIVTILDPSPNALMKAASVELKIKLVAASDHPVRGLRVLVDGLPVEALKMRGLKPQQDLSDPTPPGEAESLFRQELRYVSFAIPTRDCSVMVYADTDQASSDPDVLNLRWEKKDLQTLPTLYLLSVGVSAYKDPAYALRFPAKDARDFAAVMEKQKGQHYKDVKMKVLVNEEATRDNVLDALDWIAGQVTQKDMAMVFLAGHGINHFATNNYYYLPYDARIESPARTMVPGNEIHSILDRLPGKRILLMDTCHSGNVNGNGQRGIGNMDKFLFDITQGGLGLVVFAASKGVGLAEEDESWGNGAFTKALLEGLTGKAGKDGNGLVTWKMLDSHITRRVKELTKGKQQPTTTPTPDTADFSLAVLEGD